MIQIVSAYLLKQKGTIDEGDGPSKTKIVDRRWLINMFRNYGQLAQKHLYVGPRAGGYWRVSDLLRKWGDNTSDTTTIDGKLMNNSYTTPEGMNSFQEYSNYVWVFAQSGNWSGGAMYFTDSFDGPYYEIMDTSTALIESFDIREIYTGNGSSTTQYWTGTLGTLPSSSRSNHSGDTTTFERTCTAHPIYLNIGAPVFSSLTAGLAYCDAVSAYLQRMTEQNLQGISDALDASLNMP